MATITTIQGDTWDILSLRQYGSELYMSVLIEANMKYQDVAFFGAGIELNAPEIDTIPTAGGLPPWKR